MNYLGARKIRKTIENEFSVFEKIVKNEIQDEKAGDIIKKIYGFVFYLNDQFYTPVISDSRFRTYLVKLGEEDVKNYLFCAIEVMYYYMKRVTKNSDSEALETVWTITKRLFDKENSAFIGDTDYFSDNRYLEDKMMQFSYELGEVKSFIIKIQSVILNKIPGFTIADNSIQAMRLMIVTCSKD